MNESELRKISESLLIAAGSDEYEAKVISKVLVWGDSVGRPNQGVWRLPILCERIQRGLHNTPCNLEFDMRTDSIGVVNANKGLGHFVAYSVTQHAIKLAKKHGISAIAVNNSNFYGAGGYYASLAAKQNMIGIALSNSFPKVVPFGGISALLGTNPLAFACPAINSAPLVLDMATSNHAGSTVRKAEENGTPLNATLESFGGAKGFGLALLVEILSGVLSGAGFSHDVNSMYKDLDNNGNNGHFFIIIDINKFIPINEFHSRMQQLITWMRESGENVQYPGENRWKVLQQSKSQGINLDSSTAQSLLKTAKSLNLRLSL